MAVANEKRPARIPASFLLPVFTERKAMTHRTLSNYYKHKAGIPINGNALGALLEKGLVKKVQWKWECVDLATVKSKLNTNSEAS